MPIPKIEFSAYFQIKKKLLFFLFCSVLILLVTFVYSVYFIILNGIKMMKLVK